MSHTREFKARLIKVTPNKLKVLSLLNEAMKVNGLEVAETADFANGPIRSMHQITADLQDMGVIKESINSFISIFLKNGSTMPSFKVELDGISVKLFEQYKLAWLRALQVHAKKEVQDIDAFEINSHRVFIAQIYTRCYAQTLRLNTTLLPEKNRHVWLKVMQKFTELLLSKDHRASIELHHAFRTAISELNINCTNSLTEVIDRIEDMKKADSVIKQNLNYLEALELQVQRYLIVELAGEKRANRDWKYLLASSEGVRSTLEKYEAKWINEHQQAIVKLVENETKDSKTTQLMPYQANQLVNSGELTPEEAERQKSICSVSNDRIKELYGLLNWTRLLVGMVSDIGGVIQYGGWVPLLLEGLKFEKLDQVIKNHKTVFDSMTDKKYLKKIQGKNLEQELLEYITRMANYNVNKLITFKVLQNKELLERVGTEFVGKLTGLSKRGALLGSPVVTTTLIQSASQFVPSLRAKAPALAIPSGSAVKIEEIKEPDTYSVPLITNGDRELELTEVKLNEDEDSDPLLIVKNLIPRSITLMKTRYIRLYFEKEGKWQDLNKLYNDCLAQRKVNFLDIFDRNSVFTGVSSLVSDVRFNVRLFESEVMDKEQAELREKGRSEPYWAYAAMLWEQRKEEMFCLKYLCVEAITLKTDAFLSNFLTQMELFSETPYFIFPSSKYNSLINGVKGLVYKNAQTEGFIWQASVSIPTLIEEKEALQSEKEKILAEQSSRELKIKTDLELKYQENTKILQRELKAKKDIIAEQNIQIISLKDSVSVLADESNLQRKEMSSMRSDIDALLKKMSESSSEKEQKEKQNTGPRLFSASEKVSADAPPVLQKNQM